MSGTVVFIDWWRRRPHLLRAVFFTGLGLFVLYDVFAARHVPHFFGDNVRGFWAAFGLAGCVLLAKVMKGLGALFLQKPAGYYDRGDEEA